VCLQVTTRHSTDEVQLLANHEEVHSPQCTSLTDGGDRGGLETTSHGLVSSSSVLTDDVQSLTSPVKAATTGCEHEDSLLILSAKSVSVESSPGGERLESSATKPGEDVRAPTSENDDVIENCVHRYTSPQTAISKPPGQDLLDNCSSRESLVVDLNGVKSRGSLGSSDMAKAEAECAVTKDRSTEESVNEGRSVPVLRDHDDTSETIVRSGSRAERETALTSPTDASIETLSDRMKQSETIERVESPVHRFSAKNSPVQSSTTETPGRLPTMPAAVSQCDAQLVETVERLVQTSPQLADSSCSPMTRHSVGCSPVALSTRSASTSPLVFFQTVGCSMQTSPWLIDAQCSPLTSPACNLVSTQTLPQQCGTESSSKERLRSQRTAENSLPACGEEPCQKLSGSASVVGTLLGVAGNLSEEPQQVAAGHGDKSFEGSTETHSCEELFDDDSKLSRRSQSDVERHPCSSNPSQISPSPKSTAETEHIGRDTLPDDMTEIQRSLNDSYSLESSQVFPECSVEEKTEELKSDHCEDEMCVHEQPE